jgi:hypothetical protein
VPARSIKASSKLCADSEISSATPSINLADPVLQQYPKLVELAVSLQQNPDWTSNQVCIAVLLTCQ